MNRGLHLKLVLIMLLLIISLMTVVGAFLIQGVLSFYQNQFYEQMQTVFSKTEFVGDMRSAAAGENGAQRLEEILGAYAGRLGIDFGTRNYYILDSQTGAVLCGSDEGDVEITPNILTALRGGEGSDGRITEHYMDVALPITGGGNTYIVYIIDNKQTVQELNTELFLIIMEALLVGLVISVLLSFLLSKTLVTPIQGLTRAAERMAGGDFSEQIDVGAQDEIGVLTRTFNDMATRLHRTLEDIENERSKLATVFLHMTDGVVAFSPEGDVIHFNPAAERMLGLSLSVGESRFETVLGALASLPEVLALKTPDYTEAELSRGGRELEIFLAPISGEGSQGGALAVIHDVTEQKRADEQRREFVANVSHELRTPITSIRSYAETLSETPDIPPEMQKSFLGVIVNESDRMTKIVQDLLALSALDAGAAGMRFEPFSFEKSVTDVFEAIRLDAEKHQLTLSLDFEAALPKIVGDRTRIEQVIMNILSNAVKYTPEGGSIDIRAGTQTDKVWMTVQDTGIGIPKENIGRIFERFYRVDKARSRASGGTGLGLSIAQKIVQEHRGTIEIESEGGRGTRVKITLPIDGGRGNGQ